MLISDQVAVVTGAGSGLGRATARMLLQAGARVAAIDLHAPPPPDAHADRFMALAGDVAQEADMEAAFAAVQAAWGPARILVNCAGISMSSVVAHRESRVKFFDADPVAWQRVVAVNCIGAFLMARFAVAPMIERGWGRIISVTTSFDTMLAAGLTPRAQTGKRR